MQLGANIPVTDIGTGPASIRDFAQAAEGLGYDFLVGPDHVLGADPTKIAPGGPRMGSNASAYHDPFVLFGFLSGVTRKIEFAAGVLILAQRQAALVAKQAAHSRGRATLVNGRNRAVVVEYKRPRTFVRPSAPLGRR